MHRLFVPPGQIADLVRLTPAQSHYLESVLRLAPGAELEVFDGEGARWPARIEAPGVLRLGPRAQAQRGTSDVWLAQALARADKLDLVVQKATELAATRILPLVAERSVARLSEDRAGRRVERLRRIAQEAARQCRRSDVPRIDAPCTLSDLGELLRAEPDRRGLLLDPEEHDLRLGQAARGASKLLVVVGPEGGFTSAERARAISAGFAPVGLGRLVLRTETAGMAALSVIQHLAGELG